jgi:hypothetical protein
MAEGTDERRRASSSSSSSSSSPSPSSSSTKSIPFVHLSFFKALSNSSYGSGNSSNELESPLTPPTPHHRQNDEKKQPQENCYKCRVVGTGVCAAAASAVAYDRILGPKRPLAHSVLYGAFGLGFAGLGALRWNDMTLEDAAEMYRKLF